MKTRIEQMKTRIEQEGLPELPTPPKGRIIKENINIFIPVMLCVFLIYFFFILIITLDFSI